MAGVIVGIVLGSIVGTIATIAGSYVLFWRRRRAAVAHLHRAFRTELDALAYIDETADSGADEQLIKTVEPPVVDESNADDIGLLSGEEVEAIVRFTPTCTGCVTGGRSRMRRLTSARSSRSGGV